LGKEETAVVLLGSDRRMGTTERERDSMHKRHRGTRADDMMMMPGNPHPLMVSSPTATNYQIQSDDN